MEIARALDERIARLEATQRASSSSAGKKAELIRQYREQIDEIEQRRLSLLREIQANEQRLREAQAEAPPRSANASSARASSTALVPAPAEPGPAASAPHVLGAGAGASTSADAVRNPRILLGVCMPHHLGAAYVRELVTSVHEQLCAFADVRIACMADATKADGMEQVIHQVKAASQRAKRLADGAEPTTCFSISDQHTSPYYAAQELARWADLLVIAPLCSKTLSQITSGSEDDLLLETVQLWGSHKKRNASGDYWLPSKPFLVAPRLPVERRNQLLVEKMMGTLAQMGVELLEDPGDDGKEAGARERYVGRVVEHVKQAVLKAQGLLQLPAPAAPPAPEPNKRRRGGA